MRRSTLIIIAIPLCLFVAGIVWVRGKAPWRPYLAIKFIGFTNNPVGPLAADKLLAAFSVTNSADFSVEDEGFYYVEVSGRRWADTHLGSAGPIVPHGSGMILTRIPTNPAPWRVVVPYSPGTLPSHVVGYIRDRVDRARGRSGFNFERYGKGAPTSDWVKP